MGWNESSNGFLLPIGFDLIAADHRIPSQGIQEGMDGLTLHTPASTAPKPLCDTIRIGTKLTQIYATSTKHLRYRTPRQMVFRHFIARRSAVRCHQRLLCTLLYHQYDGWKWLTRYPKTLTRIHGSTAHDTRQFSQVRWCRYLGCCPRWIYRRKIMSDSASFYEASHTCVRFWDGEEIIVSPHQLILRSSANIDPIDFKGTNIPARE
jgi:hypothetical protein